MIKKVNKPLTIALTGGIGSGKTTVANMFKALGAPVIDTDQISRELVEPGSACLNSIAKHFGADLIDNKGELKRGLLREKIFQSLKDKLWLEKLLHPKIRKIVQKRIKEQAYPYVIVVIPLLIESGQENKYDRVLVVNAPKSLQIQRVTARDKLTPAQIKAMIAAQATPARRNAISDDIVTNKGDLKSLKSQVVALHNKYLGFAKRT